MTTATIHTIVDNDRTPFHEIERHVDNFHFWLTDEGEFEAYEYLMSQVEERDRRQVKSRADYRIQRSEAEARKEDERRAAKAESLKCSVELVKHIERMEKRIDDLVDLVAP